MLGNKLKEYRLNHCLSIQEMAEKLEVSFVCYIHWENNQSKPNYENGRKIASVLKLKLKDIYSDDEH